MPSFYYSYQKILDVRAKETDQAKVQMAKALSNQADIEEQMMATGQSMDQLRTMMENKKNRGVSVHELRELEDHLHILRVRLAAQQTQFHSAQRNVRHKQKLLHDRKKEEQKWTHLKEKQVAQFKYSLKVNEQKELDEIANQRFHLSSNAFRYKG